MEKHDKYTQGKENTMKKFIAIPATGLAAAALVLGAGTAAADTPAATDTTQATADTKADQGSLSLTPESIPANKFTNWVYGVLVNIEGLPADTQVDFNVTGPHADSLDYSRISTVSATGLVHNQINAPVNGVPEDYVGDYKLTATTADGQTLEHSFTVTDPVINGPHF